MVKLLSGLRVFLFPVFLFLVFCKPVFSQVVINEFLASNSTGIIDEDGDRCDWIELYNISGETVNLEGYIINDDPDVSTGWVFPAVTLRPESHFLVFASGKNRKTFGSKYQTIIRKGDQWKYNMPQNLTTTWRNTGFDDSSWSSGLSGFGYGDSDDATILNGVETLCIRKEFRISDVNDVTDLLLHVDYDDAFVAFINGHLVASAGITPLNGDYTSVTVNSDHEASMYSGGNPEQFVVENPASLLQNGINILAIQGHNVSSTSSDFTLIPFLTIGSTDFSANDVEDFITIANKRPHTHFRIDNDGEIIYLYNVDGELVDNSTEVSLPSDISYGRYEDGEENWAYFTTSTPGAENRNPSSELISDTVYFSLEAGVYSPSEFVELSAKATEGVIRYTTDGSVPTAASGQYTSPIQIVKTTVVRAKFFRNDHRDNPVFTNTYLMRPNNGLPVVSLSTEPENFWDYYEGILVEGPNAESAAPHYGANYWQDWEKPVNIELFDADAVRRISQGAGVKVYGSWSRANPSKSLALYARSQYGKGSFEYKLFHDRANDDFESFILRNAGNDWPYTYIRDGLISELASGMGMERLAFQPASVYLNGEYWGMLNLREKPNEHYFADNYGVDPDDLNLLENESSLLRGTNQDYIVLRNFINTNELQTEDNYEQVTSMMDINCFTDYQILQIYVHNGDWPGNNIKFWKTNDPLSKWRWLIFGAEFSMNIYGTPDQPNSMEFATTAYHNGWPNPPWSTLFLRKLLVNPGFEQKFVTRISDCLNTNLNPAYVIPMIDSIVSLMDAEMHYHQNLWGQSHNYWESEIERLKRWVEDRNNQLRGYVRNFFGFNTEKQITVTLSDNNAGRVKVNTVIPFEFPFRGKYFSEVPITLTALPRPGYRFVRWENGSTSTNRTIEISLPFNKIYHAVFEASPETEELVAINEINYQSSSEIDADDWVEIYNYGNQAINLSDWMLHDDIIENGYTFPGGTLLMPGEYLVICENMSKFSGIYPHVKNAIGHLSFGLSSDGDVIFLLNKSGDVIDRVLYETRFPWPSEPFGSGATLELKNPSLDKSESSSWGYSKLGGTPGARNSTYTSSPLPVGKTVDARCVPTHFSDFTTLRFQGEAGTPFSVAVFDITGKVLSSHTGTFQNNSTHYLDLFTEPGIYESGLYFVNVHTEKQSKTIKVTRF
ncbi:MAG: CotH kinase family protein [Prolixibacteraceae bacterium]|nr:CotH kinase family protein [Prolixibacteraceae bacterium]